MLVLLIFTVVLIFCKSANALLKIPQVYQRMRTNMASEDLTGSIVPMKAVIDQGFTIGKSITNGVFQQEVNPENIPSADVQEELIEKATQDLMNIDIKERNRRKNISVWAGGITAIFYGALVVGHVPMIARTVALYFPVALTYGFKVSGDEGL
jgi:hypothetical protein